MFTSYKDVSCHELEEFWEISNEISQIQNCEGESKQSNSSLPILQHIVCLCFDILQETTGSLLYRLESAIVYGSLLNIQGSSSHSLFSTLMIGECLRIGSSCNRHLIRGAIASEEDEVDGEEEGGEDMVEKVLKLYSHLSLSCHQSDEEEEEAKEGNEEEELRQLVDGMMGAYWTSSLLGSGGRRDFLPSFLHLLSPLSLRLIVQSALPSLTISPKDISRLPAPLHLKSSHHKATVALLSSLLSSCSQEVVESVGASLLQRIGLLPPPTSPLREKILSSLPTLFPHRPLPSTFPEILLSLLSHPSSGIRAWACEISSTLSPLLPQANQLKTLSWVSDRLRDSSADVRRRAINSLISLHSSHPSTLSAHLEENRGLVEEVRVRVGGEFEPSARVRASAISLFSSLLSLHPLASPTILDTAVLVEVIINYKIFCH